jgi:hypothetical protein
MMMRKNGKSVRYGDVGAYAGVGWDDRMSVRGRRMGQGRAYRAAMLDVGRVRVHRQRRVRFRH